MATKIGHSADRSVEFWAVGDEVYRAAGNSPQDSDGVPLGMRWECSRAHYDFYRLNAYWWVTSACEVS